MTTPRKNWCKFFASFRDENYTNDQAAFIARLMSEFTARWREGAVEWGGAISFSKRGLCKLAGKGRFDIALKSARSLAEVSSISARNQGEITEIAWPKWWESQSFDARKTPEREIKRKNKSKKEESRPPADPVLPAEALSCSELLIELLRPVPGARIPSRARWQWARDIARMPREIPDLGSEPWATIEAGIRWALGPENLGQQYEVVIRSGRALREKWPKLVAAAQRKRKRSGDDLEAALLRAAGEGSDG